MKDIPLWLKYLSTIAGIIAVMWGVYVYFVPSGIEVIKAQQTASAFDAKITGNSINIAAIFNGYGTKETSLDKQNFLKVYTDTDVYGSGSFLDISRGGDQYLITLQVSDNLVSCEFANAADVEKRLLLLRKGQNVSFTGTFSNSMVWGGGWAVKRCALVN